jgi:hypothetical protein
MRSVTYQRRPGNQFFLELVFFYFCYNLWSLLIDGLLTLISKILQVIIIMKYIGVFLFVGCDLSPLRYLFQVP